MESETLSFKTSDGIEVKQGESYYYIALGYNGKHKVYKTKFASAHDYNKGIKNFYLLGNAIQHLEDMKAQLN